MKKWLCLWLFIGPVSAQTVTGPTCAFEWNPVTDARLVGYNVYIDGVKSAWVAKGATMITCEAAKLPQRKDAVVAVTAHGAGTLESAKSNALTVFWDVVQPLDAPGVFRLRVEVTQ